MLVYVAEQVLNYLVYGPWKDPAGYNFPQTITFLKATQVPKLFTGFRINIGAPDRARGGRRVLGAALSDLRGLPAAGRRPRAGGRELRRLLVAPGALDGAAALGRHGRPGGRPRGRRAARPADAARAAGLRLRRDHRRLRRPAASGRHRLLGDPDEHVLHRRRARAVAPRPAEIAHRRVPGPAAVHAARLRHADRVPHPLDDEAGDRPRRHRRAAGRSTTRRSTRSSPRPTLPARKEPDGPVRATRRRDAQLGHRARVRRARPAHQRARGHRQPRRRRDDAGRRRRRLRDRLPHRQRLARLRRRRGRRRACSRRRSACS